MICSGASSLTRLIIATTLYIATVYIATVYIATVYIATVYIATTFRSWETNPPKSPGFSPRSLGLKPLEFF